MTLELKGTSFIAGERGSRTGKTFTAFSPETGEPVGPEFHSASQEELQIATANSSIAFSHLYRKTGKEKARFLRTIASNLEAMKGELVERASLETGLPNARFEGETARTCGQLRMFADLVEEGSWVDARIDSAVPGRTPMPKPDVRSMRKALGPVAVFCASNFPVAFSVAGGDTASALAAGCPVVVNAHSAHPGTAEIAAFAIADAVSECGFPDGTFSLLFSADYKIGAALVADRHIKAVGFTGSRPGGRALMDIAANREEPIPVFAEMSSVNPVFVLPGAAKERPDEIADGLFGSFTLGFGQFCTKPGLIFLPSGPGYDSIVSRLRHLCEGSEFHPLLTEGIRNSYVSKTTERGALEKAYEGFGVETCLFEAEWFEFLEDRSLAHEIFGPAALVVGYRDVADLHDFEAHMEGQLTVTFHAGADEADELPEWVDTFERKAGRVVFNGYPTGVEVCQAMVHGGPFPATSFAGTTSVGTRAIERFTQLVCFQDAPDAVLPEELRDGNPLGMFRMVDGVTGRH